MTLQQILEREKEDLERKIQYLETHLKNAPLGQMRISRSNGCAQYYFRNVPSAERPGVHSETASDSVTITGIMPSPNEASKTRPSSVLKETFETNSTSVLKETFETNSTSVLNETFETNSTSALKKAAESKHRLKTGTSSGYIYNNDKNLARAIAQRDYNRKLLNDLRIRYKAVVRVLGAYDRTDPEKIIRSFSTDRQKLIDPCVASREDYIKQWLAEEYPRKLFGENTPEIYTANGERVRSKSEKIIADTLSRYSIPYRYEFPLELKEFGLVHPDFMVMNPITKEEFFFEHFGMMDDEKYIRNALKKIEAYEKNDILPGRDLIITFESRTMPLNIRILENIIKEYFL